jgi:hypothetical protein
MTSQKLEGGSGRKRVAGAGPGRRWGVTVETRNAVVDRHFKTWY